METGIAVKAWRKVFAKGDDGLGFLASSIPWGAASGLIRPNDYAKQIKAYKGIVFACVKYKSNAVGSIPFKLYTTQANSRKFRWTPTREVSRKHKDFLFSEKIFQPYLKAADNVEEIIEHPILELLMNVNGHKNALDLRFETEMFLSLTGNNYWYLPKNSLDKPAVIWIIHPQYMKPVPNDDGTIKEYIYKRGVKTIHYKPDEIIHFTQSSPHSHYYGMGDVAGAADAIGLRDYMTEYEQAIFKNMGYPDVVLKSSQHLNEEKSKQIARMWMKSQGGIGKMGGVKVTDSTMEIIPFGMMHPRDMQYKTGWDTMREEVCAGFGVPISFFTDKSSALGTSDKDERRFARYTVLPDIRRQVEKLNEQLIPMYDGGGYFIGFPNPVPEDIELKIKQTEMLAKNGIITLDEARREWEYPPLGIDELLVPGTLKPIDDLGENETDKTLMRRVKERFRMMM